MWSHFGHCPLKYYLYTGPYNKSTTLKEGILDPDNLSDIMGSKDGLSVTNHFTFYIFRKGHEILDLSGRAFLVMPYAFLWEEVLGLPKSFIVEVSLQVTFSLFAKMVNAEFNNDFYQVEYGVVHSDDNRYEEDMLKSKPSCGIMIMFLPGDKKMVYRQ